MLPGHPPVRYWSSHLLSLLHILILIFLVQFHSGTPFQNKSLFWKGVYHFKWTNHFSSFKSQLSHYSLWHNYTRVHLIVAIFCYCVSLHIAKIIIKKKKKTLPAGLKTKDAPTLGAPLAAHSQRMRTPLVSSDAQFSVEHNCMLCNKTPLWVAKLWCAKYCHVSGAIRVHSPRFVWKSLLYPNYPATRIAPVY